MNFCKLDMLHAVAVLYLVSFTWQYVSHHVRFTMLKYYLREGHSFINIGESNKKHEWNELGLSYHPNAVFPFSLIADVIYYTLIICVPLYLLSLMHRCGVFCVTEGHLGFILKPGHTEEGVWKNILWFVICGILPHVSVLYFNRKRFRYYISETVGKTWINPNLGD